MQITILSSTVGQATSKAGKPYSFVELAYKGEDGQVKGKKVMPFGESKPVYEALAKAGSGEFYNIGAVKNDGTGYWDWISATKSDGGTTSVGTKSASPTTPTGGTVKSSYETSEERAKKQVYIVRQSSITAALGFLGGKAKSVTEVLQIAKQFEQYVFDIEEPKAADITELEDDVI